MRILVTGASGFVGSNTCSHLEAAGHDVIRLVHSKKSAASNEYAVDIAEPGSFEALDNIGEIDAIVHCAGIAHRFGRTSRIEFWRVNVDGARNVAVLAVRKGISRFVHLSSVLVYGPLQSNDPVTEDQEPAPADDYSSSKLAGETAVAEVCKDSGINLTILRPVPIIGEGARGNVARLIEAIDRRRFIWIGDGRNERSFVDVYDVAGAIAAALSNSDFYGTFNVTGGAMTVREMIEVISEELVRRTPHRFIPDQVARLAMLLSRPMARIPMAGRYQRTLETWLSDGVYSGAKIMHSGFGPSINIHDSLRNQVKAYLESKT